MRAAAALLLLTVAELRICSGWVPEPPESVCPWAERPECSVASSAGGVRWRLLIRQPQDGATVIYGGTEYPILLLQITYDFDDECAMIICSLDGNIVVQGEVCEFDTVAWEVPKYDWAPGLTFDSKWACRASATAGHGRTSTIEDVSTVRLVWAAESALFDSSLSPERLRLLHASTGGNATLWSDSYLQAVHSGLSWGGKSGSMSEYRQKMQIRRGTIRIPTHLGHGASVEFLPPLHPEESSLPSQQTSFRAYVVHVPEHTGRWRALESNFDCVRGLVELFKWPAVPLNDTRLIEPGERIPSERYYAFKSLTMSMTDAWQHWARHGYGRDSQDGRHEADEWAFFLEDDVDWHPDLKNRPEAISAALMEGLRLAQKDGLAALGWCVPKFAPIDDWRSDAVEVRRGNGMCGHAMAMTRWRAGSLAAELSAFRTWDLEQDVHIDVLLRQWIRKGEGNDFATQVVVC